MKPRALVRWNGERLLELLATERAHRAELRREGLLALLLLPLPWLVMLGAPRPDRPGSALPALQALATLLLILSLVSWGGLVRDRGELRPRLELFEQDLGEPDRTSVEDRLRAARVHLSQLTRDARAESRRLVRLRGRCLLLTAATLGCLVLAAAVRWLA
jgi:hypothetical protein